MSALTAAVERVTDELRMIWQVLDECREDLQWAVRNHKFRNAEPCVMHITSMPKDALASDFGTQVNRFTVADLPAAKPAELPPAPPPRQGELF